MKFMTSILNGVVFFILMGLIPVSSVQAHHSHSNYSTTEYTHLEGKVTEFHWINPHTWIYIEVLDDQGEPSTWAPRCPHRFWVGSLTCGAFTGCSTVLPDSGYVWRRSTPAHRPRNRTSIIPKPIAPATQLTPRVPRLPSSSLR